VQETVWLTQKQMAELFSKDVRTVNEHINNIFKEGELIENSVIRKFRITAADGKTYETNFYNLDVIISVGYRVKSLRGTQFRIWSTKLLREHITKGYTINKAVIKNNYAEFQKAVENIKHLLPAGSNVDNTSVLELVSAFADTWLSLEAYDKDTMLTKGATKKTVALTAEKLSAALTEFKRELMNKGEATELFGQARQKDAVAGIVGNVMQSFGGTPMYPSVEEKAAHLLYFMVKNHPFVDGNKRSGAYAFVWFLHRAGRLDRTKMSPAALTALTLFVAESEPKNKERMIHLILQLLKK
jgi:prophage maintenance system killer protein